MDSIDGGGGGGESGHEYGNMPQLWSSSPAGNSLIPGFWNLHVSPAPVASTSSFHQIDHQQNAITMVDSFSLPDSLASFQNFGGSASYMQNGFGNFAQLLEAHNSTRNKVLPARLGSQPNFQVNYDMVPEQHKPKCEEEEDGDEEEKQNADRTTASTPYPSGEVKGIEDKSCLQNKEGRAKGSQAMTSHSLAERVRRERINQRMKFLQDLVPGCDKITGKALMLDEIINYVQSLQRQVEFLSMKLATVHPEVKVDMERF